MGKLWVLEGIYRYKSMIGLVWPKIDADSQQKYRGVN